jgi:hypothetical protein
MSPSPAAGTCGIAEVVGLDDRERLATDGFGDLRDRREIHEPTDRGQLVGEIALSQLSPGVQDLGATIDRIPQDSRVRLCDRKQLELDCGHDAEAAAAAAQRPEQVWLVFAVGAQEAAVGGHELDRAHVVGGQAVLASENTDPAPERVAGHADIGRGACERR